MMRVFSLFLGIIMSILGFISNYATFTPLNDSHTDYEGVYISIEQIVDFEGGKVVDVVWHNDSDETACFGLGYRVEYLDGEEWVDVQMEDFAVPEIACIVEPGKYGTQSYRLKYFNMLRPGTYRLITEFYIQNSDLGALYTYDCFDIKY